MKRRNQKVIPISKAYSRRYPNAADRQYYVNKLLDGILAVTTGMGCVTIFFFLMTM